MEKLSRGLWNLIRIVLIKIKCGKRVNIYPVQPMRIRSQLMIKKKVHGVHIGRNFKLETNAKVRVIEGGSLDIGDNCFINCGSYITTMGTTQIGDNCLIGPNVMIFDHDHDYKAEGGISSGKVKIGDIEIGNNVWIGAGCIILRGSKIGDNCVIAAGTIVRENIMSSSLVYQKRETFKRLIYNEEKEI